MQARGEKAHGERKGAISRGLREVWEEWGKSVCGGGVKRERGVLRAMRGRGQKRKRPAYTSYVALITYNGARSEMG